MTYQEIQLRSSLRRLDDARAVLARINPRNQRRFRDADASKDSPAKREYIEASREARRALLAWPGQRYEMDGRRYVIDRDGVATAVEVRELAP